MRRRRSRLWEQIEEDDPAAGLLNLFDLWMVFAVSLLLALVTYYNLPELVTQSSVSIVKNPGAPNMEIIKKKGIRIEKFRLTTQQIGGEGEKLGTAYRLKTGEVVYVPEPSAR